jgi:hypothetical protein
MKILEDLAEQVSAVSKVEAAPKLDGRNMVMVLAPDRRAKAARKPAPARPTTGSAPPASDQASAAPAAEASAPAAAAAGSPAPDAPTTGAPTTVAPVTVPEEAPVPVAASGPAPVAPAPAPVPVAASGPAPVAPAPAPVPVAAAAPLRLPRAPQKWSRTTSRRQALPTVRGEVTGIRPGRVRPRQPSPPPQLTVRPVRAARRARVLLPCPSGPMLAGSLLGQCSRAVERDRRVGPER